MSATLFLVAALGVLGRAWLLPAPQVGQAPAAAPGASAPGPESPTKASPRMVKVPLAWDATTEKDVAGYVVSWGDSPGRYTQRTSLGLVTSVQLELALRPEPYYLAVQSRNAAGQLSGHSNEFALDVSTGKAKALKAGKRATPQVKREKPPKTKKQKPPKDPNKPKKQKKSKTPPEAPPG